MGTDGEKTQAFHAKDSGLCLLAYGQQLKGLEEENGTIISGCCKKAIRAKTGVHNSVRLGRGAMKASATQRPNSVVQRWGPGSRSTCLGTMWTPWESPTT